MQTPAAACEEVWPRMLVSGATGINAPVINGVYRLRDGLHEGKPQWQKVGDADKWIVFVSKYRSWNMINADRKDSLEGGGYMHSLTANAVYPCRATQWIVWNGSQWQQQDTVSLTQDHSPARLLLHLLILDGTGTERRAEVHVDIDDTVAQLKEGYLGVDVASGWRPRCVYRGRLLGDTEQLSQLPSGATLQCYLQPSPNSGENGRGNEVDPLLAAWARLAGVGRSSFPPEKWQDVLFHSAFLLGLAVAWYAFIADPEAFDIFGRIALRFFSLAWVVAFSGDFLLKPGLPGATEPATATEVPAAPAEPSTAIPETPTT
eukprot:TRINITY_DN77530_c0_g1_i1.p1 TRINITY_DN77530_c0_g1~~TRINITY_DN77530_c0_g1_i1.p1  ORF type:complete len:350 (+),score=53.41 TRINITY_DN77530_c0_g1_i1:98-1051(+)